MIVRPWNLMVGHAFYDRAIAFNLKVYEHRFMNTIEATKRGPHHMTQWKIHGSVVVLSCFTRPLFTCELNY